LLFAVGIAGASLTVSPSLFRYGNDIVLRNQSATTGFGRSWIDTSSILVPGFLSRYFLFANPAIVNGTRVFPDSSLQSITRIQIWRPAGAASTYTLVWERRVLLNTTTFGAAYTVSTTRTLSEMDAGFALMGLLVGWSSTTPEDEVTTGGIPPRGKYKK